MQVWSDPLKCQQELSRLQKPVALTIGNFDGVHKGHQELLKRVVQFTESTQGYPLLLTFHPHPIQILAPEKHHVRLFTLEDQQEQMEKAGLKGIMRQPFSRQFSEIPAPDFLEHYLLKYFQPRLIVVGHDFAFGAHRQGNSDLLKAFCDRRKIKLEQVPASQIDGEVISTSHIRRCLLQGQLELAEKMLGRKYFLKGVVEKGASRGRTLGFPTANIRPDVDFYPRMGVYVCQVSRPGVSERKRRAVMNLGLNRTFVEGDHQPIKAEVHILDFSEDLYGQTLKVELCHYLREERKFSSVEELKAQISLDSEKAREWMEKNESL